MPGRLSGLVTEMLEAVCPEASFPFNLIFCNLWFFHPVVGFAFGLKPTLNASYRYYDRVVGVCVAFRVDYDCLLHSKCVFALTGGRQSQGVPSSCRQTSGKR